jgi:non-specific serine/threonine protein kinase
MGNASVPGTPSVTADRLTFHNRLDSIQIGDDAWRQWLSAPQTTSFHFEAEGASFTARRELRRGRAYWYAYRRQGRQLAKAYLGRAEDIDRARLAGAAAQLSGGPSASQTRRKTRASLSGAIGATHGSGLPAVPTRLLGRDRDITVVRQRFVGDAARLVTLTGPGGTGKTRLAIEVAKQMADDFSDGVVFVDLAPVSRRDQVVPVLARALGLRDLGGRPVREGVYEWLGPRRVLLVFDNFDHLVTASADLADLLTRCPDVCALVTSREALRLRWERLVLVPPLGLPVGHGEASMEDIARSPAVTLFVERAHDRNPTFQLTAENASAVAEICTRLDGLPLGIELAAARARLLTPSEIAGRLDQGLPFLDEGSRDRPQRQRTLRDAIGWSHDLLSIEEQVLFRRLAVFVGGFSVSAAETIAGRAAQADAGISDGPALPDSSVLDLIHSLVDKSLLKRDAEAAETRFRWLETVREFGIERLQASGEANALRASHAAYCLALVRDIESDPNEMVRSHRLEREHDNVRAAMRWALEGGDVLIGLRLASTLRRFWWRRGYLSEGRRWLADLLARGGRDPAVRETAEWATALGAAGFLAWAQTDYPAALNYHREAIERWVELGEPHGLAAAQGFLGSALSFQGELRAARPVLEQSLAGWRTLGHTIGTGNALFQLGVIALYERRFAKADHLLNEALSLHREARSVNDAAYDIALLGMLAVQRGDLARAKRLIREAVNLLVGLDDHWVVVLLLEDAGTLAAAQGDAARALRLVGVASALRDRTGVPEPPAHRESIEPWVQAARRALSAAEAEAALRSGRALALGRTISGEQLRALLADDGVPGSRTGQHGALSQREREIATYVGQGRTNQEVAEELILSRRTVESHVGHILDKLGLSTRAQIAVWAAQHGLLADSPVDISDRSF